MIARGRTLAVATLLLALAGCGGGGSSPATTSTPGFDTAPNLKAFFAEPVATPSACPAGEPASDSGLSSPWVGHVDVSVYLKDSASAAQTRALGKRFRASNLVERVYYESPAEAYREFQRLYTCWAQIPRSQAPASYRLVLTPTVSFGRRNSYVAKVLRYPGVDTVSCDPSVPCVNVVESASATPTAG